ncbi:hypothetical protein [Actinoallomurus bryophytorum]|uniref:hypothetical protein n=1 Tax=Actinoallomurus bryophytorum TaxID=1490222 RepID=UPI001FE5AC39|nr:hypothetical protein [Actinoallomurus bryophytorum]
MKVRSVRRHSARSRGRPHRRLARPGNGDPRAGPAPDGPAGTAHRGRAGDNELLLDPSTYTPLGTQVVLVKGNGGKSAPPPPGVPPIPSAITHSEIYVAMGWTNTAYGG